MDLTRDFTSVTVTQDEIGILELIRRAKKLNFSTIVIRIKDSRPVAMEITESIKLD